MKQLRGFAYYLIENPSAGSGQGEPTLVKNPNYKVVPEPQWLTAEEYATHISTL